MFTVQTFLGCMWHLPGTTCQVANSSMICTYLPSLLLPEDGVTFLEDGVTSQLHWQDTSNVGHVFKSRQAYCS